MSKRAVFYNMTASVLSFAVQLGISFFLTPYIVGTLTSEAYGFISLANSFPSYAMIVTSALNGMAGRFVSIEIYKKDYEEVNRYFSSIILSNLFLGFVWLIFTIFFVSNVDYFLDVPANLLYDVKILFGIIFFNFSVTLVTNILGIALYTQNKLYLNSIRNVEALLLKSIFLIAVFTLKKPRVYYVAIASSIEIVYSVFWNIYYTGKYLFFVKFSRKYFQMNKVLILVSSGIWNCVSRIGGVLNEGLDLLICNLLLSSAEMGILSIAKTIPAMILSLINIVAVAFGPDITKSYALGELADVAQVIKKSMKVMGVLISIPLGGLIGFGDVFFSLWVPSEDARQLQILSVLSVGVLIFTAAVATVYNIFTVTNKLKLNSFVTVVSGLFNTVIVLLLLRLTHLGLYAIAGVSSVVGIIRDYLFSMPYAAKCLKEKWYTFYSPALKTVLSVAIMMFICLGYRHIINVSSWGSLVVATVVCAPIGLSINMFIVLNKNERKYLIAFIKRK